MEALTLLRKYNVAAPRYTSYPTVPFWNNDNFSREAWASRLKESFIANPEQGISLYIHLPFCESLCTYCGCNTRITKNHAVESPYIDALIKEWEMYCHILGQKPNVAELHLGGGTPTFFSPANLERLIDAILGKQQKTIECSFEGHPDNTTIAHLTTLHQYGFNRLSLGIQDFDPKVQLMINRFQTPEQVAEISFQARKIGYESINFDLIYGLPGQTPGGLTETILEVMGMKPDRIAFYGYAHVPWMKPGQRHFTLDDIPTGEDKFRLYQIGRELLIGAGYQEIGMDHFALESDSLAKAHLNGGLHRNFMGYTHRHTQILIGLGVSSISDCRTAFAQNAKTVECYLEEINKGKLAVEKGHLLTEDDLFVRTHILNLMCTNATTLNNHMPDALLDRLLPLVNDNLITINGRKISVSIAGRPFLRNICMAFDERLWRKQPETKIFSNAF